MTLSRFIMVQLLVIVFDSFLFHLFRLSTGYHSTHRGLVTVLDRLQIDQFLSCSATISVLMQHAFLRYLVWGSAVHWMWTLGWMWTNQLVSAILLSCLDVFLGKPAHLIQGQVAQFLVVTYVLVVLSLTAIATMYGFRESTKRGVAQFIRGLDQYRQQLQQHGPADATVAISIGDVDLPVDSLELQAPAGLSPPSSPHRLGARVPSHSSPVIDVTHPMPCSARHWLALLVLVVVLVSGVGLLAPIMITAG
jgi:hypothetical protein